MTRRRPARHARTALTFALVLLAFHPSPLATAARAQTQGPPPPPAAQARQQARRIEKIKRSVTKVGMGSAITVVIEDGGDLHGSVTYIGEQNFDIAEVDQRRLVTIRYEDVKKVRSGYGRISPLTGERTSQPRALKFALFAGLAALVALPLIALASGEK